MLPRSALKFLMARKFDVPRSLQLYQSHETVRIREGIVKFDPHTDPLKRELETGKFTILVSYKDCIYSSKTKLYLFIFFSLQLIKMGL